MSGAPSPLERSYRRVLRWYPPRYRREREDELVAVLLQAAAPGRHRATAAERADLLLAGSRLWGRVLAAGGRNRPGRAAGVTALGVGLLVALLPSGPTAPPPGPASLPERFAGYSHRTGSVSDDPAGPAVALFQHGWGVELVDFPQAVAVGATADTYRRVDLAERRAGEGAQGDPAPMLLSADGRTVAVGTWGAATADVAVQDLATGRVRTWPLAGAGRVVPLALSPDGAVLAVTVAPAASPPGSGATALHLLDLRTGHVSTPDAPAPVAVAAWSPDGTRVAVQAVGDGYPAGQDPAAPPVSVPDPEVLVLDRTGTPRQHVGVPAGQRLAGPGAWTPDGRALTTGTGVAGYCGPGFSTCGVRPLALVPVDPGAAPGALPPAGGGSSFLGWAGPGRVLLSRPDTGGEEVSYAGALRIEVLDVGTGASAPVSSLPVTGEFGAGRLQVAAGALGEEPVREAVAVDRGRGPLVLRLGGALLLALLAACGARLVARSLRRSRGGGALHA
ncbi:hypothetical protein NUM3379_38410 [Kineococcus sp. NUM-3379]